MTPTASSGFIVPGSSNLLVPSLLSPCVISSTSSLVCVNVLLLGSPMRPFRTAWVILSSCAPSSSPLVFLRRLLAFRILFVVSLVLLSGNYSRYFFEALLLSTFFFFHFLYLSPRLFSLLSSLFFYSSQVDHDTRLIQADMDDYFLHTPSVPLLSSYSFYPRADSPADRPDSLYLRYFFPPLPALIPSLLQPHGNSYIIHVLSSFLFVLLL